MVGKKTTALSHDFHIQFLIMKLLFWESSSGYHHLKRPRKLGNPPIFIHVSCGNGGNLRTPALLSWRPPFYNGVI